MRTAKITAAIAALTLVAAGCGDDKKDTNAATTDTGSLTDTFTDTTPTTTTPPTTAPPANKPKVSVPSGPAPKKLVIKDIKKGTGAAAKSGDQLTVNYVGVLYKTKKQFDASYDRGQPFTLTLGAGQVIPGWDKGLVGMKTGGRRELIIPPADGYGANGAGPIPANSTLVFVVDLVQIG